METLKRIWKMLRPFRFKFMILFVSAVVMQALGIIAPYFFGKIVNAVIVLKDFNVAILFALASGGILLLDVVLGQIKNVWEQKNFDYIISEEMGIKGLSKTLSFSLGQHKNEHSGIKQSVLSRGAHSIASTAYMFTYNFLETVLSVLFAIIAMFLIQPVIGMISIVGGVILVIWMIHSNNVFRDEMVKVQKMWNDNSRLESEIVRNIEVIKTSAQEEKVTKEFRVNWDEVRIRAQHLWIGFSTRQSFRDAFALFLYISSMIVGIIYVFQGSLEGGLLVTLFFWLSNVFYGTKNIGRLHRDMMKNYAAIRKFFVMFDIESDVKNSSNAVKPEIKGSIEFKNVSFTYPKQKFLSDEDADEEEKNIEDAPREVLSSVSFSIKPGERVALVGESGAGKSTTASLLLRAYDPTEGGVFIDGVNIKDIDIEYYLEHVGFVEQDVMLFDNTLGYNIKFPLNGRAETYSNEELDMISNIARVDKFLDRLPKQYDTTIGERGVRLSGGERQRVGIARALVKGPKILIFDEATSNLDTTNEKEIREALNRASEGRTVILIAHRFSTIKDADRIIVFHEGKIAGIGTHIDLLETCVEYQRLVKDQVFV